MAIVFRATTSNMRHQTRLACGLIPLLNLLRQHDVDIDIVLRSAHLRTFELFDPAFTISLQQELTIVEAALDHLDASTASLELAQRYHLHNFSVLGLAVRSCDTLADAFELINRYPRLVWGSCETSGSTGPDSLVFELRAGPGRTERFLLERDLACIKSLFSEVMNDELPLLRVFIAYPRPRNPDAFERYFNCPVSFDCKQSGLVVPLNELSKPIPTADPLSREFYEAQCARQMAKIDEPFRYEHSIRDHLSRLTPLPNLAQLAGKLNIDSRTLQRLLKKEGTTFSQLLREVRLARAGDRLCYSNYSVEQIARELGFGDAVSFSHAFKQWTGLAPRQWRDANKPGDYLT